jgi:hypothetical protein
MRPVSKMGSVIGAAGQGIGPMPAQTARHEALAGVLEQAAHAASVNNVECYRCGGAGHRANACTNSQARCTACHKRGHT